jgi:hypothetical protein
LTPLTKTSVTVTTVGSGVVVVVVVVVVVEVVEEVEEGGTSRKGLCGRNAVPSNLFSADPDERRCRE